MNLAASFYPDLSARANIPALYQPTAFALTLLPFLTSQRRAAAWAILPVLLYLCLKSPQYTFGDPSSNYYSSGPFLAMLLWYLDFAIITPDNGPDAPAFVEGPRGNALQNRHSPDRVDERTAWQRLTWAFRLMLPSHRGIGWNWKVKGVPPDPYANLPRWRYVRVQLYWTLFAYVRSSVMLVIMGMGTYAQENWSPQSLRVYYGTNAVIGWSGATWVWDRLNCFYSLVAALSVALGLCDTWEWPPLTGHIRDAWSVRQMWG